MCIYCMMADWIHRYVPDIQPWQPYPTPTIPTPYTPAPPSYVPGTPLPDDFHTPPYVPVPNGPLVPLGPNPFVQPWTQEQMDEIVKILALIKEMEDALGGCPCEEPEKMDFLKVIQARLHGMKEQIKVVQNERADKDGESATGSDPITSGAILD